MSPLLRFWTIVIALGAGGALRAADSPGDQALAARAILKKHCVECHDGQAGQRSALVILEHGQLVNPQRKLPPYVKPKAPLASQLVEFIEDGSMPPGERTKLTAAEIAVLKAWIEGGASAYPRSFDESFIHSMIVADLRGAPEAERKFYRYLSLFHLLGDDKPAPDLSKAREAFRVALNSVASKEGDPLKPIDGLSTIYRVDLRQLGWDGKPFRHIQPGVPPQEKAFNIFDFLLLEYPHGEMPAAAKDVEEIAEMWLRPASPIRPVTFVRTDWFAQAVDSTPLKADIGRLLNLGAKARGANAPDKKGIDLRPEDLPKIQIKPLGKTIPIVPLDAWYAGDFEPKGAPKIELIITDKDDKPATKFKPGDRLKMEFRSSDTVFVEMLRIDAEGSIFNPIAGMRFQANTPKEILFDGNKGGLQLGDEIGKQRFIVFAATETFAGGELLQSKHEDLPIERFVHKFYELPKKIGDPPPKFDPSKMVRKTVTIDVAK